MNKVLELLHTLSAQQMAAVLVLVVSAVTGAFWVENRYAKLRDTQARIEQQQTQVLQLQTQILNVVNALPPEVRKEIVERSQAAQALGRSGVFVSPAD